MRSYQETIRDLEKNLETRKQEEAALLNEIEVTGQAFEDMQEQNSRLLSQLREKDDAHIKLMVERVKLQQTQKVMSDEKAVLVQQATVFQEQLDAQVSPDRRKMTNIRQSWFLLIAGGDESEVWRNSRIAP